MSLSLERKWLNKQIDPILDRCEELLCDLIKREEFNQKTAEFIDSLPEYQYFREGVKKILETNLRIIDARRNEIANIINVVLGTMELVKMRISIRGFIESHGFKDIWEDLEKLKKDRRFPGNHHKHLLEEEKAT